MSADLQELYQEVILDHNRRPRNFRALEGGRKAEGYNPLCGDRLTVYLRVEDDVIADVSFQGSGCAISKASASLMTESVKGKTVAEANALFDRFQQMITAPPDSPVDASRQADGARRRASVSDPRQVREPRVAHAAARPSTRAMRWCRPNEAAARHPAAAASSARSARCRQPAWSMIPRQSAALRPRIVEALSKVFDPEIPVNIYELGLDLRRHRRRVEPRWHPDDADRARVSGRAVSARDR